ncbi:MAG: aminotransferase class V-fold PLP-dependent enzyme [Actinobacteria bacterium]|nr:aminotransferase class V-fold PLP-dependent enzyme [Actinomycetota bacterium]
MAEVPESNLSNPLYAALGLRPVIHAGGATTNYGGSRMRPETLEAMAEASRSFIGIVELNRTVGAYIAEVTGAEAGMVTSGAAGGMVLSMAACLTGSDIAKVRRLPDTTGMKDELIIQKIHHGGYSHMYTFTGAKFVEVGDAYACIREEVEAAFSERTAAVAYLIAPGTLRTGLSLPEVCAIAHARGVPVIVDAAFSLPPKDNLKRFIREGADLVTMSGGKTIRGPQATGLLYGRKDLIEAALLNNSPNHAIGRPAKVSREEMAGLYTALKLYVASDETEMLREFREALEPMVDDVGEIEGLQVTIEHDEVRYLVPTAVIRFESSWQGPRAPDVAQALIEGSPPIYVGVDRNLGHLNVSPINLQDGESEIVARRLREALQPGA